MKDTFGAAPASPSGSAPDRSEERFHLLVDSVKDYAIFMLDVDGRVLTWNRGAQALKGWSADEIIGRSFKTFYPPEAIAAGWPDEELRLATADGRFEDKGWRVRKDGSLFWASVVITAVRGGDGTLRGFAKVTRDLTEVKRHEDSLRQSEEQFRLLVESVKDYAIFMLDPQGAVLTWNAGAASILGYDAAEVVGRHFSRFFTDEDNAAGRPAAELATAVGEGRTQVEGWRVRKDGTLFWADVTLTTVRDAQGRLRGFAKVTRDLSETRRLSELERTSRRMSEFLAMLAHELRNPLAPIRNAVSIMQMQADLPPLMKRTADVIARQISHLTRLVDDLLDVGRVATGKILLKNEPLDYRDVVQACIEAVMPEVESRGHRLRVTLPPQPMPMRGDATRLAQALQNLLNNAARYTPNGGEIALAVRVEGTMAVTTVSDNGIGIEPAALERIFELFVQEASASAPSESGLGIGLSLARTLVEQHGGKLAAHSGGPRTGSTFIMHLPLAGDAALRAPAPPVADTPAPSLRVLVVDDNRDSADTMTQVLTLMGHEARGAYGGTQALEVAQAFVPQVVLLDLNMPEADGFAVLRSLRATPALARVFAVAMTGYGQKADHESSKTGGFDAHLTKPAKPEQLRDVLLSVNSTPPAP